MGTIRARFNPIFRLANNWRGRYRVLKGSAGSGKSVNVAQDYIIKLSDPAYAGANLLVVRKVEGSNQQSTFAELCGAISRIFGDRASEIWETRFNPLELRCIPTGNSIIFRGMSDPRQREKVKSISFRRGKLTWIWCEEATELERAEVDILDDRLRGDLPNPNLYYQLTLTFNPISASHWIKASYFDYEDPDTLTHHSTYLDNQFIGQEFHRRMMRRRELDPEGYQVYGLGNWGELGGMIFQNFKVHDFDCSFERFDAMALGTDFGYNHAWATLLLGYKDGDVYVCDEVYEHERGTDEMIPLLKHFDSRLLMWCDSAEPDRIKMLKGHGFRARAVHKSPGSVRAQIDWIKGRTIHIHGHCINTIKEIQGWKWRKDPKTDQYTDEPVHFADDAMAALRYGVESWRQPASISF